MSETLVFIYKKGKIIHVLVSLQFLLLTSLRTKFGSRATLKNLIKDKKNWLILGLQSKCAKRKVERQH